MDADDVFERFCKKAVRVIVAKIGFPGEGELCDVPGVPDVGRFDSLLVELFLIEGDAGIDPLADFLQAFALQFGQFLP